MMYLGVGVLSNVRFICIYELIQKAIGEGCRLTYIWSNVEMERRIVKPPARYDRFCHLVDF